MYFITIKRFISEEIRNFVLSSYPGNHHYRKSKLSNVYLHVETVMTKNSGTPLVPGNIKLENHPHDPTL